MSSKTDLGQVWSLNISGVRLKVFHLCRAAFMCGREPNFELSEGEKQELRKFKWDEFLAITRSAINNKSNISRLVFFFLIYVGRI